MDDKFVSLEAVKRTLENAYYGEATLGELLENIDNIIAAPQPMSAVEFGEKWRRLCKSFSQSPCSTCPLYAFGDTCSLPTTQSIAIVDAWTKEHPEEREEKDNE